MSATVQTSPEPSTCRLIERLIEPLSNLPALGISSADESLTWQAWAAAVRGFADEFRSLERATVGLVLRHSPRSYALWAAFSSLDCHVFLIDEEMSPEIRADLAGRHQFDVTVDLRDGASGSAIQLDRFKENPGSAEGGAVTLFTSGSTGEPKAVHHTWESLLRPVRLGNSPVSQRWLLTYRPSLYAGIQVFLHCLVNQGSLVLPGARTPVGELISLMRQHDVCCVSATPSYWRRLLTVGPRDQLQGLRLEQITLGGEATDQKLLDALKGVFTSARVVHIYATSELGRCFSVKDSQAGFPAAYLTGISDDGVELKIEEGELLVRSANACRSSGGRPTPGDPSGPWLSSGDLVEVIGDRVYFVGRRTDLINVGGNKVQPLRVECAVLEVAGVAEVRVYAKSSSLVGQMVACEFVTRDGYDPGAVKEAIVARCRDQLAPYERPRFVEAVHQIQLSAAGKKIRRPS